MKSTFHILNSKAGVTLSGQMPRQWPTVNNLRKVSNSISLPSSRNPDAIHSTGEKYIYDPQNNYSIYNSNHYVAVLQNHLYYRK